MLKLYFIINVIGEDKACSYLSIKLLNAEALKIATPDAFIEISS